MSPKYVSRAHNFVPCPHFLCHLLIYCWKHVTIATILQQYISPYNAKPLPQYFLFIFIYLLFIYLFTYVFIWLHQCINRNKQEQNLLIWTALLMCVHVSVFECSNFCMRWTILFLKFHFSALFCSFVSGIIWLNACTTRCISVITVSVKPCKGSQLDKHCFSGYPPLWWIKESINQTYQVSEGTPLCCSGAQLSGCCRTQVWIQTVSTPGDNYAGSSWLCRCLQQGSVWAKENNFSHIFKNFMKKCLCSHKNCNFTSIFW